MEKTHRAKIVIADDNPDIRELISEILNSTGFAAESVKNGYELLSYLETNNPSVIVLDLMMPDKDGLSIIDTIKQVSPYSRIVIYTGHQEYENSVYARAADGFLVKGQNVEKLVNMIQNLL